MRFACGGHKRAHALAKLIAIFHHDPVSRRPYQKQVQKSIFNDYQLIASAAILGMPTRVALPGCTQLIDQMAARSRTFIDINLKNERDT